MPDTTDLPTVVRAEMARQNLSARKLAARAKLNRGTVLDFIHGRRDTHPAIRAVICTTLGLDLTKSQDGAA